MPPPFHRKASTVRPIQTPEPTVGRVDPAMLATALGAEPAGERVPGGSPVFRYAVGAELYRRGKSKSVLLDIAGKDKPVEIQISGSDWVRLEELATALGSGTFSAGQLASIILSLALECLKENPATTGASLAQMLAEKLARNT